MSESNYNHAFDHFNTHVGEDCSLRLSALSQVNVFCQDVDA